MRHTESLSQRHGRAMEPPAIRSLLLVLICAPLVLCHSVAAQYVLENSVFGGGGGEVSDGEMTIIGTAGQPVGVDLKQLSPLLAPTPVPTQLVKRPFQGC